MVGRVSQVLRPVLLFDGRPTENRGKQRSQPSPEDLLIVLLLMAQTAKVIDPPAESSLFRMSAVFLPRFNRERQAILPRR